MTDKIDPASDALDPQCAKCGHKRSEHHYRHPFVGPSQQDTIADLQKKLAELEAANDAAEKSYRISDNGNLWRFWSDKAREMSSKFKALRKRAEAAEQRATTLEAKLAKAVDVDMIEQAINDVLSEDGSVREAADYVTRATLAEIKDG